MTEVAAAAQGASAEIARLRAQNQQLSRQLHHERGVSQGLLDAQPGLAAAAARRNQGLTPTETKVAAAATEDAKLQKEMVAELQRMNTQLAADMATDASQYAGDRVQLREQLAVERQLAAAAAEGADVVNANKLTQANEQLPAEVQMWQKQRTMYRTKLNRVEAAAAEAAAAEKKAAEDATEDQQLAEDKLIHTNEKLTTRVKELAAQVQQLQRQPETANATAQGDSRITGINRNSVGVDKGVYARQQAKLKAYRKERDQKKIYKYKPATAKEEADAVKVEELTATAAAEGNKTELFARLAFDASRIEELDPEGREHRVRMGKQKLCDGDKERIQRQLQLGNYEAAKLLLGGITRPIIANRWEKNKNKTKIQDQNI